MDQTVKINVYNLGKKGKRKKKEKSLQIFDEERGIERGKTKKKKKEIKKLIILNPSMVEGKVGQFYINYTKA